MTQPENKIIPPDSPDALGSPELQVSMRFGEIENDEFAADLFGTILRSVRSARARREKQEKAHSNGDTSINGNG